MNNRVFWAAKQGKGCMEKVSYNHSIKKLYSENRSYVLHIINIRYSCDSVIFVSLILCFGMESKHMYKLYMRK